MPILSVFVPLRKSRFFGFHVRYETLAEGGGVWYNIPTKVRRFYEKSAFSLPRQYLSVADG